MADMLFAIVEYKGFATRETANLVIQNDKVRVLVACTLSVRQHRGLSPVKGNVKTKPASIKTQRKSLSWAGHCVRMFECSMGVIFLIQPCGTSFATPCSRQIGLEWQVCDGRVMLQRNSWAKGANDCFLRMPGALCTLARPKYMKERLEEKYKWKCKG